MRPDTTQNLTEPTLPAAGVRPIEPVDLDAVVDLNQTNLHAVGPTDHESISMLVKQSEQALVVEDDGDVAGFVITLPPGATYESSRYEWFEERLDDFVYLDRVVVAPTHRRRGVATRLYDAIEVDRPVALEIYDTNDVSLAFHRQRGYEQVGELVHAGRTNLMMVNRLAG